VLLNVEALPAGGHLALPVQGGYFPDTPVLQS